ncbi:MAG: hydrogenase iron-sulfur subunit [Proteobacteria bacterium]|nr:hydrogenase iron-sulfur subunit [Pseudomonadota bacterium]
MAEFEPKVVAFCCHYCAYSAADLAGSLRLEYPANVRIVKLMCTGRVDASHLLKAFEAGADAVLVAGCEEGDCHFREGNIKAKRRVGYARKLLREAGLEGERLEMFNLGASDAHKFAAAVNEMTERARKLGPNPLRISREHRAKSIEQRAKRTRAPGTRAPEKPNERS